METISLLGVLGLCSLRDVRERSLRMGAILGSAALGIWLHLCYGRISLWDMVGGMGVGIVLYLCAYASGEKIGKGDALLVMVCGIFLGLWQTLLLLWLAFFFAGAFGFAFMKLRHVGRNYELPFVPFLLLGYVLCLFLWGGSIA